MKCLMSSLGLVLLLALTLSGCSPKIQTVVPATPTLAPTSTNAPPPTATLTATPEPLIIPMSAKTGVTSNDDWIPFIQEFDGVEMALVPAGCFRMGGTEEESNAAFQQCEELRGEGECERSRYDDNVPQHEVCFDEPFWIDVYEVTNAQYGRVDKDCAEWSSEDDQPRLCIDWFDSVAHCESRGARLPTEAEWEYAVRGPDGLIYPWGNDFDGNLVNYCDANCTFDWADKNVDDGYQNTAPVGSYPGGVSWIGAYDLIGNIMEWVNDWYEDEYYSTLPTNDPQGPVSGEFRGQRGGSWSEVAFAAHVAFRYYNYPYNFSKVVGFRCARSYEP